MKRSEFQKIKASAANRISSKSVEASGLAWDPVTQSYWMISDESSNLFEMNSKGELLRQMAVRGLNIDDPESISLENDSLYIAASVSHSKSGAMKNKRRKLIHLKRLNGSWVYHREADIYAALVLLAKSKTIDTETRTFIAMALQEASIDIEAHQIRDNALYLGFKSPLNKKSQSVILKIGDLDSIFSNMPGQAEIWKTFQLSEVGGKGLSKVSDMQFLGDKIYITGTNTHSRNTGSGLWVLDVALGQISLIRSYDGVKAEGVAINPVSRRAIIVFDGGGKDGSFYTEHSIP